MRTTLTIEDHVYAVARDLAEEFDTTLGTAVSILARRGFRQGQAPDTYVDGLEPLRGRPDRPIVTSDFVNDGMDEAR